MTALQAHLAADPVAARDAEEVLYLVGRLASHINAMRGHIGSGIHMESQAATEHAFKEAGRIRDEITTLLRPHQPVSTNDPVPER